MLGGVAGGAVLLDKRYLVSKRAATPLIKCPRQQLLNRFKRKVFTSWDLPGIWRAGRAASCEATSESLGRQIG